MRIENEMLTRFNRQNNEQLNISGTSLSEDLDFFFDNVMNSVVEYFKEEVTV